MTSKIQIDGVVFQPTITIDAILLEGFPAVDPASLSGAAVGFGVASASINLDQFLAGAANGSAVAAASIELDQSLSGAAVGSGTASASASVGDGLSGDAVGTGTASASITLDQIVSGAANGVGVASAGISLDQSLVGAATGAATASASIELDQSISGAALGAGVASASIEAAGIFTAHAVEFDGFTNLSILNPTTAGSDYRLRSGWFYIDALPIAQQLLVSGNDFSSRLSVSGGIDTLIVKESSEATSTQLFIRINASFDLAVGSWVHFLVYVDNVTGYYEGWKNGSKIYDGTFTPNSEGVLWNFDDYCIGALTNGSSGFVGAMADCIDTAENIPPATYIDNFIDGAGKPVDLGVNGVSASPTNRAMEVCLNKDTTSDWNLNGGPFGDLTVTGILTDSSFGSPSD